MDRHFFDVILVSSSALFREGLSRILDAAHIPIVATAAGVHELRATQFSNNQAILLILDVREDQSATIREMRLFKEQCPAARVALLANCADSSDHNVVAAFRSGADAYFLNPSCDTLIKSLELVVLGQTILSSALLSLIMSGGAVTAAEEAEASLESRTVPAASAETDNEYSPQLSAREKCILRGLIEGDSNKVIASENNIAEATVKVHVKAILRKIRVRNRTQAAIWATRHGWFSGGMHNCSAPEAIVAMREMRAP